MNFNNFVRSFDFIVTAVVTVFLVGVLPSSVPTTVAKDFYAAGISVLSITFSVFFAALAIIISGSDNDFVQFLEEEGEFTRITEIFRFTLESVFLALVVSLILFAFASSQLASQCNEHSRWFLIVFSALFLYSLLAALGIARDSIKYASFRTTYLRNKSQKKNDDSGICG